MSILHGVLHLLDPVAPARAAPADRLLLPLAGRDQQERSIGVILSGMGSDGTLGLRAIKEKAGVALVQDPGVGQVRRHAPQRRRRGAGGHRGPGGRAAGKIVAYLRARAAGRQARTGCWRTRRRAPWKRSIILLRAHTGHDFSLYKKNTLYRRIERRMGIHQIDKIATYVRYLQENPQELDLLFKELLIGVTSFFRDPAAWEQLREQGDSRAPGPPARGPGAAGLGARAAPPARRPTRWPCVFKEALEQAKPKGNFSLQIFATDLDRDAIDKARQGLFPANIAADVSPERLNRFFVKEEHGYRVGKEIREMVIFAPQNLIMDPPFTKLDILSCRNLLIYLAPELQKKLLPLFHYSLNPGGILFLGSAETIGGFTGLFFPVTQGKGADLRAAASRRVAPEPVEFPASFVPAGPAAPEEPAAPKPACQPPDARRPVLLQRYAPAAVLVNDQGDILYISGRTGKYLEPAAGKANWNIFAMAREGLRYELAERFPEGAAAERRGRRSRGCKVGHERRAADRGPHRQGWRSRRRCAGMVLIVFADAAALPDAKARRARQAGRPAAPRQAELERELRQAREELQTTREEMQTSQEELKSTNEELQSTNEELQSTNEELTTSKEEMQSLNEELQTVNTELQAKVDELVAANNDMKNLLNSTDIATVFLDNDLRVRRFTTQATKLIKLIPGDVGRPVTDLASDLLYPELAEDAREVLRTLVLRGEAGRHARRALVYGAHHALPHPGQPDRRRGDHLRRYYRGQEAGSGAAAQAGRPGTTRGCTIRGTGTAGA